MVTSISHIEVLRLWTRATILPELERETGRRVPYTTFASWCSREEIPVAFRAAIARIAQRHGHKHVTLAALEAAAEERRLARPRLPRGPRPGTIGKRAAQP